MLTNWQAANLVYSTEPNRKLINQKAAKLQLISNLKNSLDLDPKVPQKRFSIQSYFFQKFDKKTSITISIILLRDKQTKENVLGGSMVTDCVNLTRLLHSLNTWMRQDKNDA